MGESHSIIHSYTGLINPRCLHEGYGSRFVCTYQCLLPGAVKVSRVVFYSVIYCVDFVENPSSCSEVPARTVADHLCLVRFLIIEVASCTKLYCACDTHLHLVSYSYVIACNTITILHSCGYYTLDMF